MGSAYTLADFFRKFSTSDKCLEYLISICYPQGILCKKCGVITKFYKRKKRKALECTCGFQVSPLAGTIFEKSSTPLQWWFYAIWLMCKTRSGISAKQLQREIGVSYPTALRMFRKIREAMGEYPEMLKGTVEVDEAYIGGLGKNRGKIWWQNWDDRPKQMVMGFVERGGNVRANHIPNTGKWTLLKEVKTHVDPSAHVMTDDNWGYRGLKYYGFKHDSVRHKLKYVDGDIYTNNIENFWSHLKRGLRGVYRQVSPKYLQLYVNEFAFRYNHRGHGEQMFGILMRQIVKAKDDSIPF